MQGMVVLAAALLAVFAGSAAAQDGQVFIPNYRDPTVRSEPVDLLSRRIIRFVTSDDFPPFQSTTNDGTPFGFHVDLARALCAELKLSCTIQAVAWDELMPSLQEGRADALIAGIKPTADIRAVADFTERYMQMPARFVALADAPAIDTRPEALRGRGISVRAGTAHEAFLKTFFPGSDIRSFDTDAGARLALASGQVELMFGDGVTQSQWLLTEEGGCCAFRGGPYLESRFFGDGLAIALRKGDERLRAGLDHALDVIQANGTFGNIYLRHFPVGIY